MALDPKQHAQRWRHLVEIGAVEVSPAPIAEQLQPRPDTFDGRAFGDPGGGSLGVLGTKSYFLSDGAWFGAPDDTSKPNKSALIRVIDPGSFEQSLTLNLDDTDRGVVFSGGDIVLAVGDGALSELGQSLLVGGQQVRVRYGEAGAAYSAFTVLATLDGGRTERTTSRLTVRTRAPVSNLERPLARATWSGGGGELGDAGLQNRPKPVCIGQPLNVSPVLFDAGNRVYSVHDGAIWAVSIVRDSGVPLTFHADVATYADLIAESIPSGHYATCLAQGMIRIPQPPAGVITADVKGNKVLTGPYFEEKFSGQLSAEVYNLLNGRGLLLASQIGAGFSGTIFDTVGVGIYFDGSQVLTVRNALDALLGGVGGAYSVDALGKLTLIDPYEDLSGAGATAISYADVIGEPVEEANQIPPRWRQAIRYDRNWTPSPGLTAYPDLQTEGPILTATAGEVLARDGGAINGAVRETYARGQTAANAVLASIMALYRENRRQFRVTVGRVGYTVQPGSLVKFSGVSIIPTDRPYRVLRRSVITSRGHVELTLWG